MESIPVWAYLRHILFCYTTSLIMSLYQSIDRRGKAGCVCGGGGGGCEAPGIWSWCPHFYKILDAPLL